MAATEAQAEAAIATLKRWINAAENSNQNGEDLVVMAAAAPKMLMALEAAVDHGLVPTSSAKEGGASRYSKQVQAADMIREAIAKATGK